MNIDATIKANQLISISEARARLSSLVDEAAQKDFFVLLKKYQPKAAIINLSFLEKLLSVYQKWIREQEFIALDKIRNSIPDYKSSEIEQDIENAVRKVRKTT